MVARRGTGAGKAGQITIQDHVLALLAEMDQRYRVVLVEMDLRYQQRFDAQTRALDAALLAAEKAVQTALTAAEKAVTKAETAAEKRFDSVNEFRSAYQDIITQQMPRVEAEQRLTAITERINELRAVSSSGTGRREGSTTLLLGLIAAASVVIAAISLITR